MYLCICVRNMLRFPAGRMEQVPICIRNMQSEEDGTGTYMEYAEIPSEENGTGSYTFVRLEHVEIFRAENRTGT